MVSSFPFSLSKPHFFFRVNCPFNYLTDARILSLKQHFPLAKKCHQRAFRTTNKYEEPVRNGLGGFVEGSLLFHYHLISINFKLD